VVRNRQDVSRRRTGIYAHERKIISINVVKIADFRAENFKLEHPTFCRKCYTATVLQGFGCIVAVFLTE